jgi:hypothetical protein
MKSNVVLESTDRELFGITIKQSTKDTFLSVSDLQKAYEVARWQYGWSDRKVSDIMQTNEFKERVFYILENQGFIKTNIMGFMQMVEKEGVAKVLKGLNVYKTTGARETKSTYANPYIWILLAMELNPMIYAKVIIWLTDSLVFDRIDAGSEYMPMNAAIKTVVLNPNYPEYAKLINKKVFGQHISGMRNLASAKELRKISDIEKQIISAIDMGWIKNEKDILDYLNKNN